MRRLSLLVREPCFQLYEARAQFFNLLAHAGETFDVRVESLVLVERLDGRAPPDAGPHDLAREDARLRADDRARLHARVVAHADLPADDRVRLDDRAPRNPR